MEDSPVESSAIGGPRSLPCTSIVPCRATVQP